MNRRRYTVVAIVSAFALLIGACGDDDAESAEPDPSTDENSTSTTADDSSTTSQSTPTQPAPLSILVTNDDGIGAPGIDALVTALSALDDVEIVVVAPAENQSGSSDKTTPGGAPSAPGTTVSGVEGTAVSGFPSDSVNVALGEMGLEPDLVVSGVNSGQNVGPFAALSGTVGAARTAIRAGIPAVASSAGLRPETDFAAAAQLVVDWIEENRAAILDGSIGTDTVVSFNIPDCTAGEINGLVEAPLAAGIPEGLNIFETDCAAAAGDAPADDVTAISLGFAVETLVPAEL